ncbi:class I SAM-dependent methyltransferase [Streptomyces sp. NPDC056341]|uniref:class I SAM-dependent methyltransferase n=1 Tax=Streptomyces sp. NPDC056341 TaxID=3345788 RepID=UPI0035D7365B
MRTSEDTTNRDMAPLERVDWDAEAAAFDDAPDHGLRDPAVRGAWAARLRGWLPDHPCDLLDLGCGTGSMSLLATDQGHSVTAVDLSPAMIDLARAKLAGRAARVFVGDAAAPPVAGETFDAVLVRHVAWTLPDLDGALTHWLSLLRPGGRLILVEGVWGTLSPVGIPAARLTGALAPLAAHVRHEPLSGDALLWGRQVEDDRYAVVATVRS